MKGAKRGFTLIELLVVIALIGLFATVVLFSVSYARERARQSKARSEMSQIMRSAELVYSEYTRYPNDLHGQGGVFCLKDVVLDPNNGRKWSDFIGACNDPYGHPYEWDNICKSTGLPRNGNTSCPVDSDGDGGPIGIVMDGANGVNDGCTGDDICIGDRGHAIFGWANVNQSGTSGVGAIGSGPMCIATISSCSGLSPLGCISRSGCTLGNSSCTGTFTGSCSGLNQTSCGAQAGCSWTASGTCGGTPSTACTSLGTQTSCQGASGCSWNITSSCGGNVSCSTYNSDQSTCTASGCSYGSSCTGSYSCTQWNGTNSATCTTGHPGCTWSTGGGGKCNGGSLSCTSFSQSSCTPTGCSWSAACTGAPSCTSFLFAQCNSTSGCSWGGTGSCGGSANCGYTSQTSCTASSGCTWSDTSACIGTPTLSCGQFSDQISCQAQTTCTWASGTCTGSASPCTSYATQLSCSQQSGCSWQ